MLEVWHSKTVKQFVKTTEKHWGIGTVSQRPVMATCLTQGSGPGSSLSSSAGSPSALMFLETSPYILPLCPFSVCSSTLSLGPSGKKFNYQERLQPCSSSPLALWLCLFFFAFKQESPSPSRLGLCAQLSVWETLIGGVFLDMQSQCASRKKRSVNSPALLFLSLGHIFIKPSKENWCCRKAYSLKGAMSDPFLSQFLSAPTRMQMTLRPRKILPLAKKSGLGSPSPFYSAECHLSVTPVSFSQFLFCLGLAAF